ncbi:Uncharacterised protein [Candidatus Tiddalikarchaeum anstoanum]|nr:Uncharacterised protein [Candidatus Tiddalikarchaeum anstoanum]
MGLESALKIEIIGFNTMAVKVPAFFYDIKGRFTAFYDIPFAKNSNPNIDCSNIPFGVYSCLNTKLSYNLPKEEFCEKINNIIEKNTGLKINDIVLESVYVLKDNFTICVPIGCINETRFERSLAVTKNIIDSLGRRKFITDLKIFLAEPQMGFVEHFLKIKYSHAGISIVNKSQFETKQHIIDKDISSAADFGIL